MHVSCSIVSFFTFLFFSKQSLRLHYILNLIFKQGSEDNHEFYLHLHLKRYTYYKQYFHILWGLLPRTVGSADILHHRCLHHTRVLSTLPCICSQSVSHHSAFEIHRVHYLHLLTSNNTTTTITIRTTIRTSRSGTTTTSSSLSSGRAGSHSIFV